MRVKRNRTVAAGIVGAVVLSMGVASAATAAKRYTVPVVPGVRDEGAVHRRRPGAVDRGRVAEIPDGRDPRRSRCAQQRGRTQRSDRWGDDTATLFMNHEFGERRVVRAADRGAALSAVRSFPMDPRRGW